MVGWGMEIHRLIAKPGPVSDGDLVAAYDHRGPLLRVNFVTSLDGAVEVDGYSAGLAGPADKRLFRLLRQVCDVLLVGAGTLRHERYDAVRLDEPRRSWRAAHGLAPYLTLAVVSATLDLDPAQKAFSDAAVRPIVFTRTGAPADRRAAIAEVADVVDCGDSGVDLGIALAELRRRGLAHVLSEGGPHLFASMLAADLVDELCLTVSPLLAGPGAGRIVAGRAATAPRTLRLISALDGGDGSLLLRYGRHLPGSGPTR